MHTRTLRLWLLILGSLCPFLAAANPPDSLTENDYYGIVPVPVPKFTELEVGGLAVMPDGSLLVSTRFGDVWRIENPYVNGEGTPNYTKFASGLHEVLGLAYRDGAVYCAQRGELTRLRDSNADGKADIYERVCSWPLSGNYHEYSFGPKFLPGGDMVVTLNLGWVGYGASLAKWRGWMLRVSPEGKVTPWATGLRSPSGIGVIAATGDVFYSENQGDWVGSGRITHLESGDFAGNPGGLRWTGEPGSPLQTKAADIPDTGEPMFDMAKTTPHLKPPAVWFPHGILGIATSDILEIPDNGFGPFAGQFLVGDQGHSKINRMALEKVKGVYQGACFPFREGFSSGILRLEWGADKSLLVGMTSRGWASTGKSEFGLQRLVWNGRTAFEMKNIRATPDGFEVEFTMPADKKTAANPASYSIAGFNYKYHHVYGSPVINQQECRIRGVIVSDDGRKARLVADGLREGYIHEIKCEGVQSGNRLSVLHPVGYYTLNRIPDGDKIPASLLAASAPHNHAAMAAMPAPKNRVSKNSIPANAKTPSPVATMGKRVNKLPAAWTNGPDQTVVLGTKTGLQYDAASVGVKAGSRVKLVFSNNDDMQHNLVIVLPGAANQVGEAAIKLGLKGMEMNYVPNSAKVLYHTGLLTPGAKETIYFTAPNTPGSYTIVCTYPGHYMSMQSTLKVTK